MSKAQILLEQLNPEQDKSKKTLFIDYDGVLSNSWHGGYDQQTFIFDPVDGAVQKMNEYILLQRLTMIANNLLYVAEILMEQKRKITSAEKNYLSFCSEMYKLFYNTYYNPESKNLLKINEKRKQFTRIIDKQGASPTAYYFWEIVRILGSSGSLILYKGLKSKV